MKLGTSAMLAICLSAGCTAIPGEIPVSATAGPGPNVLSAFDAGVIFADAFLIRGANFEDHRQGLAGFPFTQNSATGTFYHNTANLSVKVTDAQCSMVYVANASNDAEIDNAVSGLAQGSRSALQGLPAPRGINVTSTAGPQGQRFFRLAIASPVQ